LSNAEFRVKHINERGILANSSHQESTNKETSRTAGFLMYLTILPLD